MGERDAVSTCSYLSVIVMKPLDHAITMRKMSLATTYEARQLRTFRNWTNWLLKQGGKDVPKLKELDKDLDSGVHLIKLAEVLGSPEIKTYIKNPKSVPFKLDNISLALNGFKEAGVKISVNSDIFIKGKRGLILGFFWQLILWWTKKNNLGEGDGGAGAKKSTSSP